MFGFSNLFHDFWEDCFRKLKLLLAENRLHAFFKQHFHKQHQAEIGKNQANAKEHPEAELLFENYSYSSSTLSSKNNRASKK